jgi:hypothetical protein
VKNVCFAILLLSVFLILLGHDLIPHIHDIQTYGGTDSPFGIQSDSHHSHEGYHGHDADHSNEGESSHTDHNRETSFPYHRHLYSDQDLEYTRTNTHHPAGLIQITITLALHSALFNDDSQNQKLTTCLYRDKPFLIKTFFQPAANPLRGPPSIA